MNIVPMWRTEVWRSSVKERVRWIVTLGMTMCTIMYKIGTQCV